MPHADPVKAEDYRAQRRAEISNDPERLEKKRAYERARYHRKKKDPRWLNRRRKSGKASMKRRDAARRESGRASRRKTLYGITRAEFDFMLKEQGGHCAICPRTNGRRALAVDHDHATGKVRGLLCDNCNHTLGKMRDDPELLRRAADYLASFMRAASLGAV